MGNSIEIAKHHYARKVSKEWMEKFWALKPTPNLQNTSESRKPLKGGYAKIGLSEPCQKKTGFGVFLVF